MLNNGWGGVKVHYLFDGWYKQAVFEITMKNFRLFETEAEMNETVIEECSVSYVIENNKVYTTPENNGEITFKLLLSYWDDVVGHYIDETISVKSVRDMTWGEFIDSAYNTLNFRYSRDYVRFDYQDKYDNKNTFFLLDNNNNIVELDDFIMPNHEYISGVGPV